MRRKSNTRQQMTLGGLVFITLALCLMLSGCTGIITYIRSDNSTGTARCEPETDTGGIFSVRRDCIINQPTASPGNVNTSTERRRPPAQNEEGPQ